MSQPTSHPMLSVTDATLKEAANILGADGSADEGIESSVAALVHDTMLARRLIDWLPEAFGMVLLSHMAKVNLPTTFSAKNKHGDWIEFDLDAEPIVEGAIRLATQMHHGGPRHVFANIASRSAVLGVANRALSEGKHWTAQSCQGRH